MTTASSHREHRRGVALCLLSATAFGLMAIFAKEAYRHDVSVLTLLAARFALAACAFWAIVAARRPVRLPARRVVAAALAMGAVGYAAQSGGYFGALTRMSASMTALILYTYPALVFALAVALRRERADRRRLAALGLATAGVALVLVGGGGGSIDPLGLALGVGAAVAYSIYILVADRVVALLEPFLLSALIATGAAVSLTSAGVASGSLHLRFDLAGWGWIAALALVSTVTAISAFMAGLSRVGPSTASILSTVEPVVTVALAMVIFGERLGPLQIVGGALVLSAVVLLQAKVRTRVVAAQVPAPAPAGALAKQPARG